MKFRFTDFAKKVYAEAMMEDITTNAAQVAFYFIFALFPLLLFLLSVFGLVLDAADGIKSELFNYLGQIIPGSALKLIQDTLTEVVEEGGGGKLTFGAIVALWSASAGIDNIRIALNDIYDLKETRPYWKYKLTSVLLTLAIALLVFFALGVVFYGSSFINLLLDPLGIAVGSKIVLGIFSILIVGGALVAAFALIYSFAPNHTPFTFRWITPGAITAIATWLIFSGGFRLYLHFFDSYSKTYGSVGAIIVLLLWLYLTALVILLGGVVNAVADETEK
jgi:membrane protein